MAGGGVGVPKKWTESTKKAEDPPAQAALTEPRMATDGLIRQSSITKMLHYGRRKHLEASETSQGREGKGSKSLKAPAVPRRETVEREG